MKLLIDKNKNIKVRIKSKKYNIGKLEKVLGDNSIRIDLDKPRERVDFIYHILPLLQKSNITHIYVTTGAWNNHGIYKVPIEEILFNGKKNNNSHPDTIIRYSLERLKLNHKIF